MLSYLSLKDFDRQFLLWLHAHRRRGRHQGRGVAELQDFRQAYPAISELLVALGGINRAGGRHQAELCSVGERMCRSVCALSSSLSVRIALSFNNDKLAIARAKVARFMEMGLAARFPDKAQDGQRIKKPEAGAAARRDRRARRRHDR